MHHYSIPTERKLNVAVIGAGGNGSAIFLGLPYLHQAMQAWGHPGLHVTLVDGDTVSPTNCIRQPFSTSDIGQNKATVLVNRVNLFWGVEWSSAPTHLSSGQGMSFEFVIGCVDSKASRRIIESDVAHRSARVGYWLDLGNGAASGQFVLGQPFNALNQGARLLTGPELYPELVDSSFEPESDLPSCSAVEALQRQEPFINQTLAMQSLAMLTQLFRYGQISYQGGFFNARTGVTQPIRVKHTQPPTKKRKRKA